MGVERDRLTDGAVSEVPYGRLILGGIGVGAVVFGLGSRLAMRFVGLVASPEHLGDQTAFGVVGKVTVAGVVGLVVFGAFAGLFTGLLYLGVRLWVPGTWLVRGLVFGLLLLPPVGIFILASSRADFGLTSPTLILAVFAAMILVEALGTAWLIEKLGRDTLPAPRRRAGAYVVLGVIASLGFVALAASVSNVVSP